MTKNDSLAVIALRSLYYHFIVTQLLSGKDLNGMQWQAERTITTEIFSQTRGQNDLTAGGVQIIAL